MTQADAREVAAYLDLYYLTEAQLADGANIASEDLREMVRWRCVPPHTHQLTRGTVLSGCFGTYTANEEPVRYYHPSVLDWIAKARLFSRTMPLWQVAERQRQDFFRDFVQALDGRDPPWDGMDAEQGAAYAWAFVMDGTWGACLKVIDIPSMLAKESARATFRDIAALPADRPLSAEDRARLAQAVAGYDRAAQAFAPHERPESSRVNEFEPAKARLDAEQDRLAA